MAVNYVYFQRGSKTAYNALKNAGRIDNNALYFIYDSEDSSTGSLYLGTKLIRLLTIIIRWNNGQRMN